MKIKVTAETKYVGSRDSKTVTVDDEDLEDMDDRSRAELLEEIARVALFDLDSWGWEEA